MSNGKVFRLIGFAYGGLTAIIILIAFLVVTAHIDAPVAARSDAVLLLAR
jgi:hypothetical protein